VLVLRKKIVSEVALSDNLKTTKVLVASILTVMTVGVKTHQY